MALARATAPLVGGPQEEAPQSETPRALPRTAVAGHAGVFVRSTLEREGAPPTDLTFVHLYRDRSRLNVVPRTGLARDAQRLLRFGSSTWMMDANQPASRPLLDEDRQDAVLALELRRALFLWPAGLEWVRDEAASTAEVELRLAGDDDRVAGALVAHLDEVGRPSRLVALSTEGLEVASLTVEGRSDAGEVTDLRTSGWDLLSGRETVQVLRRANVFYHDTFFIPPDRRQQDARGASGFRPVRELDLQRVTHKRIVLPEGCTWDAARVEGEQAAERAADELEGAHRLDPRRAFEIDWKGSPRAVLVRLQQPTDTPPDGWTTLSERPGIALGLRRLADLDTTRLAALRRGVPQDAEPGTPYVLLLGGGLFEAQAFVSYAPPN